LKLNSPKDIKVVFKQEQVFVIKKILIKKRFSGFGKKKKNQDKNCIKCGDIYRVIRIRYNHKKKNKINFQQTYT
jgi:ribosomal protein S26